MDKLSKAILILNSSVHRENIITGLQCYGAMLKSTILELQAIKVRVRQRKEALPKGKDKGEIYVCFKLSDRSRIEMYESKVEGLEGILAGLTEKHMKNAREMQPELYSNTNNKCWNQGTKYTVTEYEDGDGGWTELFSNWSSWLFSNW